MGQIRKKIFASVASITMVISLLSQVNVVSAAMPEYEIYPTPHKIVYQDSDFILRDKVNAVCEDEIDTYTLNRLKEVIGLKKLSVSSSNVIVDNSTSEEKVTNILVGVYGSNGYVDKYVKNNLKISADLFNKTDSYYVSVDNGTIVVLGKDTDSAFYGLTTLYHVFNQLESRSIRNFEVEDYADVASRGFIEGYYGNPWSVEDRAELMKFGGYYKMNTYFYAPKDDPKHKDQWDVLYTADEIETKIKPLAKAGNESKCRYAFALHPFPSANHFDFDNYDRDLAKLKAKFKQVIDAGVRQIAILADDFWNPGGNNGLRLIKDMTSWLENEVREEYADMKITLPYVPFQYGGNGSETELQVLKNAPENVQLVMTGGKIWGEVTNNFTDTFTKNVGRGPFMWINWPCTDNSHKHLIMGGYTTFLHPGVSPENIQGIMLNPMQQSEPSKVAIFGNACYSWNIWETEEEANKIYDDSFKYVDHNSSVKTSASEALKELSKHMINQNMDSRVTVLQESVVLKEKLESFKKALTANTVTTEQLRDLIKEFTVLQNASKVYRNSGNKRIKDQIVYWLDCWDDTTESALSYLKAIDASVNNDNITLLSEYSNAQKAFAQSKSHGFLYVNYTEYAEVGVQHIVPFIKAMDAYVSSKVASIIDPSVVSKTFISDVFTNPAAGEESNLFDGDDSTSYDFHSPLFFVKGNYIGVQYSKGITVNSIRFSMGGGKNHFYHSKLQYTKDGKVWVDVDGTVYDRLAGDTKPIEVTGLNLTNVLGVRLICTADNNIDSYMIINSIDINKPNEPEEVKMTVSLSNNIQIAAGSLDKVIDGDKNSELHLKAPTSDTIPAGATVKVDFGKIEDLQSVYIAQALSQKDKVTDYLDDAVLEYYDESAKDWKEISNLDKKTEQTINTNVSTRAIRIRNKAHKAVWWRLGEIQANFADDNKELEYNVIKTKGWNLYASSGAIGNLFDGNDETEVEFDPDGDKSSGRPNNDIAFADDYIGYDFGKIAKLSSIHLAMGGKRDAGNKFEKYTIETSLTGEDGSWTAVPGYENYVGNTSGKDIIDIQLTLPIRAQYIRVRNLADKHAWIIISEFNVQELQTGNKENLYTNAKSSILSKEIKDEDAFVLSTGNVTLNKDQYIGLKFSNIKSLNQILLTYTAKDSSNLKLQVSKNEVEWVDVKTGVQDKDARYIRLINTGNESIDVRLSEFKVIVNNIQPMHFYSSNIEVRNTWGDARNNGQAFDNVMSSYTKLGGRPMKDQYVIYDLGQQIDINSLRIYVSDAQNDYIRDAKIQLSDNLKDWKDLFEVGDGVADKSGDDTAQTTFKNNDSNYPNYVYVGNDKLNISGRYLRILITADFPERAIVMNEIMINGGAYLPVENNRDFVGALEERGHQPSYMTDGDLSTTYKSSVANSSMQYYISELKDASTLRIIQNGEISHANVKATFYNSLTKSVSIETVEIGKLDQSINEFIIPDGKKLLSVDISWGDNIPEISEILLTTVSVEKVNKDKLIEILNKEVNDNWTRDAIEAFNKAKAVAESLKDNDYVTQDVIDNAVLTLQNIILNAQEKGNTIDLEKLINEMISNDNEDFTIVSYMNYQEQIDTAKASLTDKDNLTSMDVSELIESINNAKSALVYSMIQRENAEVAIMDDTTLEKTNYSDVTYSVYSDAKTELQNAINKDKEATTQADRVTPTQMRSLVEAFNHARSELADIAELKAVIADFDNYDSTIYTTDSYEAYKNAVEIGKQLLKSGTKESIAKQINIINEKQGALHVSSVPQFNELIKNIEKLDATQYTVKSYQELMLIVEQAKKLNNPAEETVIEYIEKLNTARNALVSIAALNERIHDAEKLNKDTYTHSSYAHLTKAIDNAKATMKDGSREEVKTALDNLSDAINQLQVTAANELSKYRKEIKIKDAYYYTVDSYKLYKDAFDKIMGLSEDISMQEFINAKAELDKYTDLLQYKDADYSQIKDLISKIPSDLSVYSSESVVKLNKVLGNIVYGKTILDQGVVDQYAKNLYEAIQGLTKAEVKINSEVKTSDITMILPMMMGMIIAGCGLYFMKKKSEN